MAHASLSTHLFLLALPDRPKMSWPSTPDLKSHPLKFLSPIVEYLDQAHFPLIWLHKGNFPFMIALPSPTSPFPMQTQVKFALLFHPTFSGESMIHLHFQFNVLHLVLTR